MCAFNAAYKELSKNMEEIYRKIARLNNNGEHVTQSNGSHNTFCWWHHLWNFVL